MAALLKIFGLSIFGMVLYFVAVISELLDPIGGLMYSPDHDYTRGMAGRTEGPLSSSNNRRPAVTKNAGS